MILFRPAILNIKNKLKLKDVSLKVVRERIKERNIKKGALTVLDYKIAWVVLGSFRAEVKRIVGNQLVRSSKESES